MAQKKNDKSQTMVHETVHKNQRLSNTHSSKNGKKGWTQVLWEVK